MEPFILAAQTVDGYIAKDKTHSATWTSKEDKQRFVELTKDAGVVVMGSTTFKTLPKPLKNRLNVIYSNSIKQSDIVFDPERPCLVTSLHPKDLIKELQDRGYTKVAICGGAEIYSLFLESGLVKKIYLTIEPVLFGTGISLFKRQFEHLINLKLDAQNVTEKGTVFLDYSILN